MKINAINFQLSYRISRTKFNQNSAFSTLSFQRKRSQDDEDVIEFREAKNREKSSKDFLMEYIKTPGKVKIEDYENAINTYPYLKKVAQDEAKLHCRMKTKPDEMARCAIALKKHFDTIYGDDYVLVSVGLEPSLISELMENLGTNVVYLPIVGLRNPVFRGFDFTHPEKLDESVKKNTNIAMQYLESKGINKDCDKKIILLDLCSNEYSNANLKHLIVNINKIPKEKIVKCSLLSILKQLHKNPEFDVYENDVNNFHIDFLDNVLVDYSSVPGFNINNRVNKCLSDYVDADGKTNEQIFKELEDYNAPRTKAYMLCAIDEAYKILGKKNPQ